ncbi:MAG: hypothetical protein L6Q68_07965 [Aquabacterium sp.]|nr:hypothetical protein [Aquabacterium sp.]
MRPDADEPHALPSLEALMAATLALMTGWAGPCPQARVDEHTQRRLIARKIVSNLFFLQHHPQAPPNLRQVCANAHARWQPLAADGGAPGAVPSAARSQNVGTPGAAAEPVDAPRILH